MKNLKKIKKLVKRENREMKFGLLGHPLKHSLSPVIHRDIMKQCKIKGSYELFDVPEKDFEKKAIELFNNLDGFNITIPYKEKIAGLTRINDESAQVMGCVNTVIDKKGFNTDLKGFSGYNIDFENKKVCLLGAGGVCRTMLQKVLEGKPAQVSICSRRKEQGENLAKEFSERFPNVKIHTNDFTNLKGSYDIILNGTPVGMWPHCEGIPVSEDVIKNAGYIFDSIYNPISTRLILKARSFGKKAENGLEMLCLQALESQKIWNEGKNFTPFNPENIIPFLKSELLRKFPVKYVLTGFMGSGKSTAGKKLAKELEVHFADLDLLVVESCKMSIPAIFKTKGEKYFREKERYCLEKLMNEKRSMVISAGGGALINPANVDLVRQNQGFIIYLELALDEALKRLGDTCDRPLLEGKAKEDIQLLYKSRLPVYKKISDYTQNALPEPGIIVEEIKNALGFNDF